MHVINYPNYEIYDIIPDESRQKNNLNTSNRFILYLEVTRVITVKLKKIHDLDVPSFVYLGISWIKNRQVYFSNDTCIGCSDLHSCS